MRAGLLISAVTHVAVVALALLGTPKLFDSVPLETIEVDLVRAPEAEPPKEPEQKPPDKLAEWNPLPEAGAPPAKPATPEAAAPPPAAAAKQAPTTQQARAAQPPSAEPPRQPQQPWIFDPVNI